MKLGPVHRFKTSFPDIGVARCSL